MKNLLFLLAATFLVSSVDLSAAISKTNETFQGTKPKKSRKKPKTSNGKGQKKLKSSKGKPHKDPAYR